MMVFYYKGETTKLLTCYEQLTLRSVISLLEEDIVKATKSRHRLSRMKTFVCTTWIMLCFLAHLTCGSDLECIIREIAPAQLYKCSGVLLPTLYKRRTAEQRKKGESFNFHLLMLYDAS